jgi:hypothetical protein
MIVTVIGTGYVGSVTGACLAYIGHHVTCVDNDPAKIEKLAKGESPIYEPHLEELLSPAAGRIRFTTDLAAAVAGSDVVFIAVGTPPLPSGEADLGYVEAAAHSIGAAMDGSRFRVVVNKSTVPVGSGNLVETLVREGSVSSSQAIRFGVASNPRVFAGSERRRRFAVSGPDRNRSFGGRDYRRAAEALRGDRGAELRAAGLSPAAAAVPPTVHRCHIPDERGDDQVRCQRVLGDKDRVCKRGREHLRARRRGRVRGHARDRARFADRLEIPQPRRGVGLKLFREGRACASAYGDRVRL